MESSRKRVRTDEGVSYPRKDIGRKVGLENTKDKSGLFVVKHGTHFFVVNIVNMTSTIDDYNEVSAGMRNSLDELYFMYVINAPGSDADLLSLIREIHVDENRRKSCRMIHLLGSGGVFLAISQQIVYNKQCSIGHGLPKGIGTRDMMHASIYMCMTHFGVKSMKLQDKSRQDNEASVQRYSLMINGQGWYEKHFQAVPDGSENKEYWEENIQYLDLPAPFRKLENLENSMELGQYEHINILREYISEFKRMTNNGTWRKFFSGYKYVEDSRNNVNADISYDITLFTPKFIERASFLMGFFYVRNWVLHFDKLTEDFSKTMVFKTLSPIST